jgi:putative Mg2+ transporter-C (MgtC) family protein
VRALLGKHGFSISGLTYRLADEGRTFEYRMTIRTGHEANFTDLARALAALPSIREFDLSPAGD